MLVCFIRERKASNGYKNRHQRYKFDSKSTKETEVNLTYSKPPPPAAGASSGNIQKHNNPEMVIARTLNKKESNTDMHVLVRNSQFEGSQVEVKRSPVAVRKVDIRKLEVKRPEIKPRIEVKRPEIKTSGELTVNKGPVRPIMNKQKSVYAHVPEQLRSVLK